MDNLDNLTTPEDNSTETSFGQEIAKSFVISTAVSAGVLAGFMAVGLTIGKLKELKEARAAKKVTLKDANAEA